MSQKKLFLHVGLPKTASTALQFWCHEHREQLKQRDINYPFPEGYISGIDPKHQFLVVGLILNDMVELEKVLQANEQNTLVLSAEGLTNRLPDFSEEALATFRKLTHEYEVSVFMVVREKNAWTKSYYKQLVIHPPMPEYHWATSLSYDEFCKLPRIQRLTNISSLSREITKAFGAAHLCVAEYENDWMKSFLTLLNISDMQEYKQPEEKNISLSDDLVEIIRQINGMGLSNEDRESALATINNCFQTKHMMLNRYRLQKIPNKKVFTDLIAHNPSQQELINQLLSSVTTDDKHSFLTEINTRLGQLVQLSKKYLKRFNYTP